MKQLAALSSVVVLTSLMLACSGEPVVEEAAGALPDGPHPVIVVAVDGLRADWLGCYGGPELTPAIDALAAESVRFDSAWAQAPEMLPSLAALLSGMYPTSNGLRSPGDELQAEAVTLAEVTKELGMTTAAFVEGRPGGADYGLAQGFGSYQVVPTPGADAIDWMGRNAAEDFLLVMAGWGSRALEEAAEMLGDEGAIDPGRIAEVLASRGSDDPKLFNDAELARIRDWYAARIQVVDRFVAGLVAELGASGLDRRATLILVGTSGFALQEHGDLFGETVYAPVTRVPLLIRLPGGSSPVVVDNVVEVLDLMPTVADLLGAEVPAPVQGASLLPVIEGTSRPPYVAFGETPQGLGQRFVALAGYRAVATGDQLELFHTAVDPLELEDLAEAEPDKLAKLANDLEAWSKMVAATSLDPELRTDAELDDETLKQLKSLGYIQ